MAVAGYLYLYCVSLQVRGRVQRGYLKCEEVRDVYEADTAAQSKATIYTSPGRDHGQIFSWSRDQVCKLLQTLRLRDLQGYENCFCTLMIVCTAALYY